MAKQVEYTEMMDIIIKSLIEHNKPAFIGVELIKGSISLHNIEDADNVVRSSLEPLAYHILLGIKQMLGAELIIVEEGTEILTEFN